MASTYKIVHRTRIQLHTYIYRCWCVEGPVCKQGTIFCERPAFRVSNRRQQNIYIGLIVRIEDGKMVQNVNVMIDDGTGILNQTQRKRTQYNLYT
jgi:hypothetical protein